MDDFYKEKIEIIFDKFYDLFMKMLKKKNNLNDNLLLFEQVAENVKKYYPQIAQKIDRVIYYYIEVDDSDEKMDYLMSLYKRVKECCDE